MAWYYGTHICGHEARTNVIGPMKNRQWHIDRFFERECEECYSKKRKEEIDKANAEALVKTKEYDLPELTGTEKQVNWANTLRIKMIEDFSNIDKHFFEGYIEEDCIDDALSSFMENQTQASFFIDCRNLSKSSLLDKLSNFYADYKQKEEEKSLLRSSGTLLVPEEVKYDGIVMIKHTDEHVTVAYEKNNDLAELLKSLKYKRKIHDWRLKLTEFMVDAENRIAELGCLLLEHGFTVSIQDAATRQKVLQKDFKPTFSRWLSCKTHSISNKLMLALSWDAFDQHLYTQAKKITNAKWDSPYMMIDIEYYEEVLNFADDYDFGISDQVYEKIEEYKKG